MKKLELLAPAKDKKTAFDAINCGADAIYIAANKFGARKNAANSLDDIEEIVNYAHIFNVKVYITINTILKDEEINECIELINKLYEMQIDAIIIQDFAILQLSLEGKLPPVLIHISTQANNRTFEKIKFFEEIGAKRVILARELSLNEIEKISKNSSIELEHFIAGALCVSYSGECYMSEYIGSRSANRGECAQACRKKYSLIDEDGKYILKNKYLLSLKDNNLSNHIDKLVNAGIISFKIEGRLKDSLYVKNNVLYYHNILKKYPRISNGKIISDFNPNPFKTFNRAFQDDYLFNKKDNIYNFSTPKSIGEFIGTIISANDKCFVVKTKYEINLQDGLCFILNDELNGCLVNTVEKVKEGYKIYPNKKVNLKIGEKIYRNIDFNFNKTLENTKTSRKLDVDFQVFSDKLIVKDENNNKEELFFNEFFEKNEIGQNQEKLKENYVKSLSKTNDTPYLVRNIEFKIESLTFLPVSIINELRRVILEKLTLKILSRYKTKKQKPIDIAQFPSLKGDYKMNVHNLKAKEFYENCGCEIIENSFESILNRSNKELMRTKHCLKNATVGCGYNKKLFLEDEKQVKYPLCFDCKNCEMVILSP